MCNDSRIMTPLQWRQLPAWGTTYMDQAMTPWLLLAGSDAARVTLMINSLAGNFRCKLRYQTASVTISAPNAWQDFSTVNVRNANGAWVQDQNLSEITNAMYIRFGAAYSTSSGAGGALVGVQVALPSAGGVPAYRQFEVQPVSNSGESMHTPITGWLPASVIEKVMAAFIVGGASGIQYQLSMRTADFDTARPNAWAGIESGNTTPGTTYSMRNTGTLTPSLGSAQFVQFGVLTTGTGATALIQAILACLPWPWPLPIPPPPGPLGEPLGKPPKTDPVPPPCPDPTKDCFEF